MEFKIAAVRETFEESGYLVPPHASFEPLESLDNPAKRFEWRQRVHLIVRVFMYRISQWTHMLQIHESPAHFKNIIGSAILQSESSPPYQNLLPWAHWITPFFERVRFSTLFFLHLVPETESLERLERKMSPDGSETVSLEWIKPSLAIAAFEKESRMCQTRSMHLYIFPRSHDMEQEFN